MVTAFYIAGREKFAVTEEILFANQMTTTCIWAHAKASDKVLKVQMKCVTKFADFRACLSLNSNGGKFSDINMLRSVDS